MVPKQQIKTWRNVNDAKNGNGNNFTLYKPARMMLLLNWFTWFNELRFGYTLGTKSPFFPGWSFALKRIQLYFSAINHVGVLHVRFFSLIDKMKSQTETNRALWCRVEGYSEDKGRWLHLGEDGLRVKCRRHNQSHIVSQFWNNRTSHGFPSDPFLGT